MLKAMYEAVKICLRGNEELTKVRWYKPRRNIIAVVVFTLFIYNMEVQLRYATQDFVSI